MAEAKRVERPLSPFMIGPYYRPQMTSISSIMVRITGIATLGTVFLLVAWLLALRPGFTEPMTPLAASAAPGSLAIMLVGYALILPVIAVYSIYQYRVFKGQGVYEPGEEH